MSKKNNLKKGSEKTTGSEMEFSPKVENVFKLILRIMSWIVGIVFVLIILLPELNSPFWDNVTRILFYIGLIDFIVFIIIEFVADSVKKFLSGIIDE